MPQEEEVTGKSEAICGDLDIKRPSDLMTINDREAQ